MAARDAKPSMTERNPVVSYAIAVVGVVVACTSVWWWAPIHHVGPILADTPPIRLMLVLTVMVAAWRGGLGPGLLATVLGIAHDRDGQRRARAIWRLLSRGSLASVRWRSCSASVSGPCTSPGAGLRLKEQEFHRSEGRYRRLVETAGEGIWVIDRNGRTTYANPRLGEMLGVHPGPACGHLVQEVPDRPARRCGSLVGTSQRRAFVARDPPSWRRRRRAAHDRDRAAAGSRTNSRVTASVAPADDVRGFLLMVTDVTPLKKTEEALREKESVLRSFYESSVMAMGVVELAGDDTASSRPTA